MDLFAEIKERVATLEASNAALKAEIASLKNLQGRKVLPEPAVPLERGVRISEIPAGSGFIMPSQSELDLLKKIVGAKHDWMIDVSGPGFYGDAEARALDWRK